MKQPSIPAMPSSRPALACSLALTLGLIAGCVATLDETRVDGEPEVGSSAQGLEEMLAEPFNWFAVTKAESCEEFLKYSAHRQQLLTPSDDEIEIQCSLTLGIHEVIRRPIVFRKNSDNVWLDCQDHLRPRNSKGEMLVPSGGGWVPGPSISHDGDYEMIGIRSDMPGGSLEKDEAGLYVGDRPENIVVQNCMIGGHVRIQGISGRARVTASSHDFEGIEDGGPSHITRARALAPTNIVFYRVKIIGKGQESPLYVADGVSRFVMVDSEITGRSGSKPGIYFDQESTENTILNSKIAVSIDKWANRGREQLAMDATSYDFIVGNRISGLDDGGLSLYRNCGEHGTIRYSTPSYNVIFENEFVYKNYYRPRRDKKAKFAVHLSSRNGEYSKSNPYCELDRLLPGGEPTYVNGFPTYPINTAFPKTIDTTFVAQNDNAHDNIVTSNEFLNRPPKDYMKNDSKLYNFTAGNREVRAFSSGNKACYSPLSFGGVLLHGNVERAVLPVEGEIPCVAVKCNNGQLEPVPDQTCSEPGDPIAVECRANDTNNGCQNFLSCPLGQRVTNVKAACNLENGSVTDAELASVPMGSVRVTRASDPPTSNGSCYVLNASLSTGTQSITVQKTETVYNGGWANTIPLENGVRTVNIGCKEKDANGGDCHVRAEFTCEWF